MGLLLDKRHGEEVTLTWPPLKSGKITRREKIGIVRELVGPMETLAVYTYSLGKRNRLPSARHNIQVGDVVVLGEGVSVEILDSTRAHCLTLEITAPKTVVIDDLAQRERVAI